jgi:hypothetical protein
MTLLLFYRHIQGQNQLPRLHQILTILTILQVPSTITIPGLNEYRKVREFLEKFGMIKKEDKDQVN